MASQTDPRREPRPDAADRRPEEREQLPTWENTRPRANQEPDRDDLARSRERLEALLGR
jgi:hypothetical protein